MQGSKKCDTNVCYKLGEAHLREQLEKMPQFLSPRHLAVNGIGSLVGFGPLNKFEHIITHLNKFEQLWTHLNRFRNKFEHIWIKLQSTASAACWASDLWSLGRGRFSPSVSLSAACNTPSLCLFRILSVFFHRVSSDCFCFFHHVSFILSLCISSCLPPSVNSPRPRKCHRVASMFNQQCVCVSSYPFLC